MKPKETARIVIASMLPSLAIAIILFSGMFAADKKMTGYDELISITGADVLDTQIAEVPGQKVPEPMDLNITGSSCKGCNVIMISIDTLNKYHLPCYGYEINTSPAICEFAKEGILFDNFISHAALTPVAQMSIFTSQYPSVNGLTSFYGNIQNQTPYLPMLLQRAGYRTVHFGTSPEFAIYNEPTNETEPHINQNGVFKRGFDLYRSEATRDVPHEANRWINKSNGTFFLWISLGSVHHPYGMRPQRNLPKGLEPVRSEFFEMRQLHYGTLSRIYQNTYYDGDDYSIPIGLKDEDLKYIQSTYDGDIYYTDKFLRSFIKNLEARSLLNNTIVIIHGIHGEDLGEHGYFGHYDLYDVESNNLLIIYSPTINETNIRIGKQVQGIDLAPTIIEMLGFEIPKEMQGSSIFADAKANASEFAFIERIPLWEEGMLRYKGGEGSPEGYNKELYDEFLGQPKSEQRYRDTAIRTNEWKLIHRKSMDFENEFGWYVFLSKKPIRSSEYELYDLKNDPLEQENVMEKHPQVAKHLREKLLEFEKTTSS